MCKKKIKKKKKEDAHILHRPDQEFRIVSMALGREERGSGGRE